MFFSSHPAMVQIMSFDIKIDHISNDRKNMQCLDPSSLEKAECHLHYRKYSVNSGDDESILCFSLFIQLWFMSCPLTSKFIKFQLIASTSCVFTSLGRTKFIITCIVVHFLTIQVIMKNILCFSYCIQLWFKSCPLTSKFITIQMIACKWSVWT